MQAPYLLVIWPPGSISAAAAAQAAAALLRAAGWTPAAERLGVQAWIRSDRPAPASWSPAYGALVVGRRWERTAAEAERSRSGSVGARALALCTEGWGSYVALVGSEAEPWAVFRDPSGAVEALTWSFEPLAFVASGLTEVPPGLLPRELSLDWGVIADYVRRPVGEIVAPPLHGVQAIAPGALQPLPAGAPKQIWRPRDWLPATPEQDPRWPERLVETTLSTTAALMGPYRRVLTEASGGLDSSIVNAAVALAGRTGAVAGALHYVGDRREADERAWAQALAARYGLPLLAVARARDAAFDPEADFAELAADARPPFAALDAIRDRDTARQARHLRCEAIVTGKGGDGLFFQMPSPRVLSDLWRAHGPAAVGRRESVEVARWLRRSVWSVWREAWTAPPPAAAGRLARFAGPALRELPTGPVHPWLEGVEAAPPGKQLQIRALVGGQAAVGLSRRSLAADLVQPLLAQPLLELCLGIPSWELVRGGRDRGLARTAFAAWLPPAIATRRSKGALTSIYARRAAAGAEALRAHLLDGTLVRAGLLDAAAVAAALTPEAQMRRADGVDLLAAAALESWVRRWQTRAPDAPGASRPRA